MTTPFPTPEQIERARELLSSLSGYDITPKIGDVDKLALALADEAQRERERCAREFDEPNVNWYGPKAAAHIRSLSKEPGNG